MEFRHRQGVSLVVALAILLGLAASWANAQESQPRKDRGQSKPWIERYGRYHATDKHQRDHETVKVAFREVVSEPHKSTVKVMSDGKTACQGCIVAADGYIVTKASELTGAVTVKLHDKRVYDATIVGIDSKSDLAMIKINAEKLPVVAWREGTDIPAVGSILASPGLETLPLAIGVVSVQPRAISAPNGVLGIVLADTDGQPKIEEVFTGGAADKAGMKVGDVIVTLNGRDMKDRQSLIQTVRGHLPGEKVTLKVKRGDAELGMTATLMNRPASPDHDRRDFQNALGGELSERRAGFPLALQHDTILSPEDCGGPVVDLDGRAVGINIARAGRVNSYALPVSVVLPLLADLKAGKYSPNAQPVEVQITKRWDELKQNENSLARKLAEVVESIQKLQREANVEELLRRAQAERDATEKELGKVKAELAKLEQEKTSTGK